MNLFVYGTLLEGMDKHEALAGAQRLGPALVRGDLLDLGDYTGLVEGDGFVIGEIYQLDPTDLVPLDELEGFHPGDPGNSLYIREDLKARRFADGVTIQASTYIFNRATGVEEKISSGDFRRHYAEKHKGPLRVIAYGSNLSTERLAKRLSWRNAKSIAQRSGTALTGYLNGFRLTFNKTPQDHRSPCANIEFVGGESRCPAVAWHLTVEEIKILDDLEGASGNRESMHYYRVGLPFQTKDTTLLCQAYLANPDWLQDPGPPDSKYLEYLRKGYQEHGLDLKYLDEALLRATLR